MEYKIQTVVFLFFIFINISLAQVGIYTKNPQKELHIAGNTSTIRIDGLNGTNNANNLNEAGKTYPVHVNADGDLTVGTSSSLSVTRALNLSIPSASNTYLLSTPPSNTNPSAGQKYIYYPSGKTFTLKTNTLVIINYNIPISVVTTDDKAISDGKAKIITTYVRLFRTSSPASLYADKIAIATQKYTNFYNGEGSSVTGPFFNTASHAIVLPAGTYLATLFATAFAGSPGTTTAEQFKAVFGKNPETYNLTVYTIPL